MHNNYIISSKLKNSSKIVSHYIMLAQFNHVLENVCRHMLCAHVLLLSWMSICKVECNLVNKGHCGGRGWKGMHGRNDRWRCGRQYIKEGRGMLHCKCIHTLSILVHVAKRAEASIFQLILWDGIRNMSSVKLVSQFRVSGTYVPLT